MLVLGQYIAPVLGQCWTIIAQHLGQYHMPALARFTASVQRMYWANTVYTGLSVLALYWPSTVMLAGVRIINLQELLSANSIQGYSKQVR